MNDSTVPCLLAAAFCCAGAAADTVTIHFDSLDAVHAPLGPMEFLSYLGQQWSRGEVWAPSRYNLLTTFTGGTPSALIFQFGRDLSSFSFTRPTSGSLPGETTIHPSWRHAAFDRDRREVAFVEEDLTIALRGVPARTFRLEAPAISYVMFTSDPMGTATIDAVLIDSMVLTYATPSLGGALLCVLGIVSMTRRRTQHG